MTLAWPGRMTVGVAAMLAAAALTTEMAPGFSPATAAAQRPTVDTSMDALVTEVRALRVAVERSGVVTAQAQMMLGRLQLQENRLATLGRQAQDARMRLQEGIATVHKIQADLARVTERLETATAADERRAMEHELAHTKLTLKLAQGRADLLRQEDSEASHALTSEQSRWSDINGRLEALERTLSSPGQRDR